MEEIRNRAISFLKKYEIDYEDIDMEKTCDIFVDEMKNGLEGKHSSLEMIPTYIETDKEVPINKPVIVMDAGGTNFRVAIVHFDEDRKAVIEKFKLYSMPGVEEQVSKEKFFEIMAGYVKEVISISNNVGFCFSYPAEIFPNKDGKLIRFSKEINAKEVEGQMIGENLNIALGALGHASKHVVLLNDTVATLLAGRSGFQNRVFDSYVGFILGTGTNCAYIESNENIAKKPDLDPAKSQIINIESGGFGKAPMSTIDNQFDMSTKNPGEHTFEKMISGAYFGPLCLRTIHVAAEDGLFSNTIAEELKKIQQISTKDVSDFMYYPLGGRNPLSSVFNGHDGQAPPFRRAGQDAVMLYYLLDRLIERAAKLTAINLSSVTIKDGKGQNPCRPVCIVAEGTTFYQLKSLKQRVECYLKKYLKGQKNIYYEIVNVENATLIGAAIAGLTN